MSDIDYKDPGSLLNPFRTLAFFARKPVTEALEPRPASDNYRGFHVNDWEQCIGCATCQKVCDNAAISMIHIPDLPADELAGVRPLRPAIDYGRCCWCGLCVDVCPTGSISLSREYVHTCRDEDLDSYFILPDPKGMHGVHYAQGWSKTPDADLLEHERQPMAELEPESRSDNFDEIVAGFDPDQAIVEASRCVQCGMCHDACPTHMHAPEYIRAIWEGRVEDAVREIYRTNPFAHVCGRVCTHRCETACSIGRRGEPVAIRWLKRYAMDALDHETVKKIAAEGKTAESSGRTVAIVGAGPAGLTAAYDLARQGHAVTVFEARDKPGGMTRYGIPDYRLPAAALDFDIDVIRAMGVDIRLNVSVGTDIPMRQLRDEYDVVLLGLGMQLGRSTRVPGADQPGVFKSVDLLRAITDGEPVAVPDEIVVIGGGNVAMDIARSLARLQRKNGRPVGITVTALEDWAHFLADPEEVREASEEGINILPARGPQEIVAGADGIQGLRTWAVSSIFDEKGRFAPRYDESDEQFHSGAMVVEAIGQMSDVDLLGQDLTEQLEWRRGRLAVDDGGRTSVAGLWAAGDMVNGPDVVHAVADGHRVAASIQEYLMSEVAPA